MLSPLHFALTVFMVLHLQPVQADSGRPMSDLLQGSWRLVSAVRDGRAVDMEPDVVMTFSGNKYSTAVRGNVVRGGTIFLYPTKKPVWIDVLAGIGPNIGKTARGIIEVQGEVMRRCLGTPDTNIRALSCADPGVVEEKYERVKTSADAPRETPGREFALYEWSMVGPKATVRMIQVAILRGKQCRAAIDGLKDGQNRSEHKEHVIVHREACLDELPAEIRGVLDSKPIRGAYYSRWKRSLLVLTLEGVDIMYGLDIANPEGVCDRLLRRYRQIDENATCVPPTRATSANS
jgi:uncharacterized protein (TIGR03067 family)